MTDNIIRHAKQYNSADRTEIVSDWALKTDWMSQVLQRYRA